MKKKIPVMPEPERKRGPMPTSQKVVMLVTAALALVMVLITFIDMAGYHLISAELIPMGCVLVLVLLLTLLAMKIHARRRTDHSRRVTMLVSALVIMMAGLFLSTMILQYAQIVMPSKYSTIRSPEGRKVVILAAIDNGFGGNEDTLAMLNRMEQRQIAFDAEKSGEPAAEMPEVPSAVEVDENGQILYDEHGVLSYSLDPYDYEAYGYIYCAYPVKLGLFYSTNVDCEGLIYRGVESEAKLLADWTDENTVELYLENPEPGDSGTCTLKMK